jgi:hypothetical protein
MNHWLQTKLYGCQKCPASYRHDEAYMHSLFLCPNRGSKRNAAEPSDIGSPVLVREADLWPFPVP